MLLKIVPCHVIQTDFNFWAQDMLPCQPLQMHTSRLTRFFTFFPPCLKFPLWDFSSSKNTQKFAQQAIPTNAKIKVQPGKWTSFKTGDLNLSSDIWPKYGGFSDLYPSSSPGAEACGALSLPGPRSAGLAMASFLSSTHMWLPDLSVGTNESQISCASFQTLNPPPLNSLGIWGKDFSGSWQHSSFFLSWLTKHW